MHVRSFLSLAQCCVAAALCITLGAADASVPAPIEVLGSSMRFVTTGAQTKGASSTIVNEVPAGGGPPAHVHTREDETYVVTRGHFRFWLANDVVDAPAGKVVYLPRNVPHQFENVGDAPGEVVIMVEPSGLDKMFLTMAQQNLLAPRDLAKIVKLGRDYGITYLPPLNAPH